MMGCINNHVSAGLFHAQLEENSKREFDKLLDSVEQVRYFSAVLASAAAVPVAVFLSLLLLLPLLLLLSFCRCCCCFRPCCCLSVAATAADFVLAAVSL